MDLGLGTGGDRIATDVIATVVIAITRFFIITGPDERIEPRLLRRTASKEVADRPDCQRNRANFRRCKPSEYSGLRRLQEGTVPRKTGSAAEQDVVDLRLGTGGNRTATDVIATVVIAITRFFIITGPGMRFETRLLRRAASKEVACRPDCQRHRANLRRGKPSEYSGLRRIREGTVPLKTGSAAEQEVVDLGLGGGGDRNATDVSATVVIATAHFFSITVSIGFVPCGPGGRRR